MSKSRARYYDYDEDHNEYKKRYKNRRDKKKLKTKLRMQNLEYFESDDHYEKEERY